MKNIIALSILTLFTCNISLLASEQMVTNIKNVLEMYQPEDRCPSPSVSQSSASVSSQKKDDITTSTSIELKKILFEENKNENKHLLFCTTLALRNLEQQANHGNYLSAALALKDFKRLLTINWVPSQYYPGCYKPVDSNGKNAKGLNPTTQSAILLREAGLTYTDASYKSDFIREEVKELVTSIK